jgi:hypothetical protein
VKRGLAAAGLGAIIAWLALPGSPALACTCEAMPVKGHFEKADAVFKGEILSLASESDGQQRAEFRVLLVYKGDIAPVVDVRTKSSPLECGLQFSREAEYLVFGTSESGGYSTSLCAGTTDDLAALERTGYAGTPMPSTTSAASIERPLADGGGRTMPIAGASAALAGVIVGHVGRARVLRMRRRMRIRALTRAR